ncbi:RNA-directed DNA polymerase from mobile element jockey [Penaeus vannamei]|uniref:RNA-directed DNA polymerase from mobile element jockey n=1 Tax=Penaeus vannamei TaxID=6689 RepID=A0A3R7MLB9_PENVA|nr:RNA-directed DNA polymerase from mobile element jockey [Penaeus vannamei]
MIRKLRHIFNACLATGYFPDKFKHATITLIAKSGKSAHEVGNYRPISLLEVPGKLLERLITRRLITHLENNNKHNSRQYGFRPHRGTESAIALAYEEIALGLANKHQINIILRDVSKAFDKVWHDGLKYKIIQLQLPTHLTRLLCSFLDHRTATIRLGSHLGTPLHLRSGVPQGSVLSPTLYILYTANLPQPTPHSNYFSYADDVTQIISHPLNHNIS